MLDIITIILSILVVILGYTTFNLLRKNEKYEDSIENYISFFNNISTQIQQSEKRLKEIDEKGIFAGDDEIGWFFNEVKKIQNNLSKFKINP